MQILLVRNIIKLLHVRIIPLIPFRKLLVPHSVRDREAKPQAENDENLTNPGDHTDYNPRLVFRRFVTEESVGSDNVTYCYADEDGSGGEGFLGRSAYVAGYEG